MKVRFFDPGRAYLKHRDELLAEYDRVRTAGDLVLRYDVSAFERNLAEFVGTKYAVALNSGTDALVLALKAAGVGTIHWSVAVPAHTFKSTAGAVKTAHPDATIDVYDLHEIPEDADVAIVAHIAGELYPLPKVNYYLIEDAAQALGAVKNPTSFAQCWSFYPAKILGAPGDAGAVTTNDERVADYVRGARNHFKDDNCGFGINSRLDNVWAAELNVWFRHLPARLEKRKAIADKYGSMLWALPIILPQESRGRVWQDYIIRTTERDTLFEFLKTQGIETLKNEYPWAPGYTKPPVAAQYEKETLRLPCNPEVMDEEVEYVIAAIQKFYDGF